jgi:hypothetical protein
MLSRVAGEGDRVDPTSTHSSGRRPRRWGVVAAVAGAAAGTVAAVLVYASAASLPAAPVSAGGRAPAVVGHPLPAAPPRVVYSTLPCPRHTHLVHGTCVTRVVRTVVVHDPAPAPVADPTPAAVAVPAVVSAQLGGDQEGAREREDHEDDGGHDD